MNLISAIQAAFVCSLILPMAAVAQSRESRELAKKVVIAARYEAQMESFQKQCIAGAGSVSPETWVRQNPQSYGGLTPASPHWPKVVKAYDELVQDQCARPTKAEMMEATVRVYERDLSVADLKSLLAFLSTEGGQRAIAAGHKLSDELGGIAVKVRAVEVPKALGRFERRLAEIMVEANRGQTCPSSDALKANRALQARFPECMPGAVRKR